ncbi:hypothetical protein BD779DRAFT_1473363 [Infundibulicybe gibba]|nr:hypothetical protein BD779DRAFT_1473363 [Infundibulicybe gibba]
MAGSDNPAPASGSGTRTRNQTANGVAAPIILPSDSSHPSVPILVIKDTAWLGHALLSKNADNWHSWSTCMRNLLTLSNGGLHRYLNNTALIPDPVTEPRASYNYALNDESVRAFIHTKCDFSEHSYIEECATAHEMWSVLKTRHEQQGPISQITLLQEAFTIRYSHAVPFAETAARISVINRRIWAMGAPTADGYECVLNLIALSSPEMRNVRDAVTNGIAAASKDKPYAVSQIHARLDMEQKVLTSEGSKPLEAHAARNSTAPARKTVTCSNCKRPHHDAEFCIKPGGGMAGRTVQDAQAASRAKKGLPPKASTSATPATSSSDVLRDAKGRAFAVDASTGRAYFLDADPAAPAAPAPDVAHVASLAADPVDTLVSPLVADSMTPADLMEYAWLAAHDSLSASVDWAVNSRSADFGGWTGANIAAAAGRSPISSLDVPFLLDSACSTHISPDRADFFSLHPVSGRLVHGVGGSSIRAVGIGSIKLSLGKGRSLRLDNVLYIPDSTFCLASCPLWRPHCLR